MASTVVPGVHLPVDVAALERFSKIKLAPSLKVLQAQGVGGTWVFLQITWTTLLADASLRVILDGQTDVTSSLTIDDAALKAMGCVDAGTVGGHHFDISGDFLARLLPVQTVHLTAAADAYCPY